MNIQRIRNLTTGILHTKMSDIYEDIEFLTTEPGIMTHMLPAANAALQPFLKKQLLDPRFWDDKYDTTHTGDISLNPMNEEEKVAFFAAL